MLFPFYIFGIQLSFKISKLSAFCSKMDDEHKERERIKIFEKVKCLDCQCFGNLRTRVRNRLGEFALKAKARLG